MKKRIASLVKILITAILILSLVMAIALFGPLALGYKEYKITSFSMSPVINPGDVILVKVVDPQDLQVGDIITFYMPNSAIMVTHRILRIDKQNERIYTIGDQNTAEDPSYVSYQEVIGKYTSIKLHLFR